MVGVRALLLLAGVLVALLGAGQAFAQDDDEAWNEITGLMNSITAMNQQLAGAGMQWTPGQGTSGSEYVDALAYWCMAYAQMLNSVDAAFGLGGTGEGGGLYDPFDPRLGAALQQQLNQMQTMTPDVMKAYQNNMLFQMNDW